MKNGRKETEKKINTLKDSWKTRKKKGFKGKNKYRGGREVLKEKRKRRALSTWKKRLPLSHQLKGAIIRLPLNDIIIQHKQQQKQLKTVFVSNLPFSISSILGIPLIF